MRSDRQRGRGAGPRSDRVFTLLFAKLRSSPGLRRPESATMGSSRLLGAALLLFASAGTLLLIGSPAFAQTGYIGVPPVDPYVVPVGSYVGIGTSPGAGVRSSGPTPQGSPGAVITVGTEGLGAPPDTLIVGRRSVVTGWDLVVIAAVGLTAVAGFAVPTGRFRSR